jgi:hypothetical protein
MGFPGSKVLGVDEAATSTVQEHELGITVESAAGQVFRYVKAGEAIAAYQPVDWNGSHTALVTDAGDIIYGVAQVAIASGSYGWVLEKGPGIILGEASLVAGPIGQYCTAGGFANAPLETKAGEGTRGVTHAAEAATPAGVACSLF